MEPHSEASRRGLVAAEKAGRGGDRVLGHLTPGELVVPLSCQTHELMALFAQIAHQRGLNPNRFIVGSEEASRNPKTGLQEFLERDSGGVGDTGGRGGGGHGGGHDGDGASAGGGDANDGGINRGMNSTGFHEGINPEMGGNLGRTDQAGMIDATMGGGWFGDAARAITKNVIGYEQEMAVDPTTGRFGVNDTLNPGVALGYATGIPGLGWGYSKIGIGNIGLGFTPGADLMKSASSPTRDESAGSFRGTGQTQASDQGDDDPVALQRLRRRGLLTRRTA